MSRNTDTNTETDAVIDATRHARALAWARALLPRGIEVALRRSGRLYIWPVQAWAHGLTEAERDFYNEYRAELRHITSRHELPETTVTWSAVKPMSGDSLIQDPGRQVRVPNLAAPTPSAPTTTDCPYCGGPCLKGHRLFGVLHWTDPAEVARRNADATQRNVASVEELMTANNLDAAIESFVSDVFERARHIVRDPTNYGGPRTMDALADDIMAHRCPEPDVLAKVAGYVVVVLGWKAKYQPLTTDEQHALDAAHRLLDACDGARQVRP